MFNNRLFAAVAFAAAVGTGAPAFAQTASPAPIEAYGALPAIADVSLSPDGGRLAYIRREGDQSQVVVQARSGEVLAIVETSDRRVRDVAWASDDHVLIVSATTEKVPFFAGREELAILDIINVNTRRVARAMQAADHRAFNALFRWTPGRYNGQPVLYAQAVTNENGLYSLDLYRIDLNSGRGRRHAAAASDTRGYIQNEAGDVVARVAYEPSGGLWRLSAARGGGWRDIRRVRALLDTPGVVGLGRTNGTVLITEPKNSDYRLMELALDGDINQTPVDLGPSPNRVFKDKDGLLVGIGFMEVYQEHLFFDERLKQAWELIRGALPNRQLSLSSYNDDLTKVVFFVTGSGQPGAYYLYDADAGSVSMIGRSYPSISTVAEVRAVRYKAQDGLDLMGYLTLPPDRSARNLPLIMMPHGGPAARDYPSFDWWAQALASRGYAVFQPQFRGSEGFGAELLEAGYGQWGRKMQTDISDAIPVLSANGVIDPDRICIVGASYGGYAALAGMTLQPGAYKCAVAVAGVSDLREMLLEEQRLGARGNANPAVRYWSRFMGADSANDTSIDAFSPARLAARVEGPILLIHGRQDTTVPFVQSEYMARALGAKGRLIALEGEDHYLSTAATRQRMLTETVSFLEQHLPPL